MAEKYGHFDATNGEPQYAAAADAAFFNLLATGIVPTYLNELIVQEGLGLQVLVDSGGLIDKGYYYINDADASGASPLALDIDAEVAGSTRFDLIAIEFNIDTSTIQAVVEKGTTTPVDTSARWQVPLATVEILGGDIVAISDVRSIQGARIADGGVSIDGSVGSITASNQHEFNVATASRLMSSAERTKLAGIQTGAQVNRAISNSVTSTSSSTSASSYAAKIAYDRGTTALNEANTKEDALSADRKRKITISTSSPSGGTDGDVWLEY